MGSDFYYVNYNLQLCILRNLLLTGRFPPTNLRDSKIIDWIKRIKRNWTLTFFFWGNFFFVSRKWSIVLPILCASIFLKGISSLSGLLMLLILGLDHIFEMKAETQYGFWSLFESACCSFFEGVFISDRYIFLVRLALMMRLKYLISFHNPVRRTRNWFLAVRSSLLFFCYPVTNTRCSFLFLAG